MVIKEILEKLKTTEKPVARIFHKGTDSKILFIGFKKGMRLDHHKTQLPSILLVISGQVNFIDTEQNKVLNQYDECNIPVNVMHEVIALEDSICMLTQG
ncbi:MAG: hypothetical protein IPO92_15860 [Saprospiraceae bacterium]|nr:hypothetical protein [Saprospiraceae bacterium]